MANEVAPKGKVYVCGACGKRSRDRYGFQKIDSRWDESCMMNCFLADESDLITENGRVVGLRSERGEGGQ